MRNIERTKFFYQFKILILLEILRASRPTSHIVHPSIRYKIDRDHDRARFYQ